jgi:phage portal protein BeeE
VAKLFQTLFRSGTTSSQRSSEISRYDLSAYINQLLNNPLGAYGEGYPVTTRDGRPVEDNPNQFTALTQRGYKANGPIFAIILARLMLFSEARFQFRRLINGRPGDLFGTKALEILEHPWPNGTTGELLARMEQDVSLAGNFYCVNEGDRLRRLRPDWVSIVLTGDPVEDATVDVAGYVYRPGGYGDPVPYLPDEVCHWSPVPDPEALYRGMSWVTPVVRELQADDAATRHKEAFFKNGAKPGLVVSLKDSIKEEQFRKFVRAMNESHQGADQAYRTLYLAGGADVTVAGANMQQLDFRGTQGAGETRLCAAGGVPPIIVGLSEGLASATYSNYGMARRKFGDHWARPQWRSACAALSNIITVPGGAELWYDDGDIAFLREDQKDAAEIQSTQAGTINTLITAGFTPESAISAVTNADMTMLVHTGLVSVQLQPPGGGVPQTDPALAGETPAPDANSSTDALPADTAPAGDASATGDAPATVAARAKGRRAPVDHDGSQLHEYWTRDPEGLAKWADTPTPYENLYEHLLPHMDGNADKAHRTAAAWFHDVFHFWPGSDENRVTHGHPPRGKRVGPG